MNIELLRTFLEVNRTRHFAQAAEALFLTQAAVSARIKSLEALLGVSLFERRKRDIQLTPEGHRLIRHAESIMAGWRKARLDVSYAENQAQHLAVGGMFSLWDILLQDWLHQLHTSVDGLAVIAESFGPDVLLRRVLDGALDLIFVFEPPQLEELLIEEVAHIDLVMVSGTPGIGVEEALQNGYVMVDWGLAHALEHGRLYPDAPPPAHRMNQGRMALAFLLACGGTAYLAAQMVLPHIDAGELFPVPGSRPIRRAAFAAYSRRSARKELIREVLKMIPPSPDTPVAERER